MRFALAVLLVFAQDKKDTFEVTAKELQARRMTLCERVKDGAVVIDAGPLAKPGTDDRNTTPVLDFKYLTNYHEDGGILIILPKPMRAFLFVSDPKAGAEASGLKDCFDRKEFEKRAPQLLGACPKIYTKLRETNLDALKAAAPRAKIEGQVVERELTKMRMVKSALEIKLMKKAADATNKAHLAAMKAMKPGMNEGEIQKLVEDTFKAEGCDELSFPSIVGSGKNGTILHYQANKDPIPESTLVVCDIGASIRNYVTDITRTLPSGGKFTDEQRAAYQCVLDAQKAAEKLLKPGANMSTLHSAAAQVFQQRKLTKWSFAHSQDRTIAHGLGHHVGLAVHDSDDGSKLEIGAVVTIEPGYYDKERGWGIRIEDIYVVTAAGFERLSAGAPREVDEIEKLMKEKK